MLRNSYIGYNGYRGVNGNKADRLRVEDNTIENNNLEHFKIEDCGNYCTVAGIKVAHTDDLVIKNNYIRNNYGTGFWCDLSCTDAIIVKNSITDNAKHGAYYEVSSRAIIASNIIARNGECGLKISGSDKVGSMQVRFIALLLGRLLFFRFLNIFKMNDTKTYGSEIRDQFQIVGSGEWRVECVKRWSKKIIAVLVLFFGRHITNKIKPKRL